MLRLFGTETEELPKVEKCCMTHLKRINNLHSRNTYYVGNEIKEKLMKREWKHSRNLYKILVANCEWRTSLGKFCVDWLIILKS